MNGCRLFCNLRRDSLSKARSTSLQCFLGEISWWRFNFVKQMAGTAYFERADAQKTRATNKRRKTQQSPSAAPKTHGSETHVVRAYKIPTP